MNSVECFCHDLRAAGLDYTGPIVADGKLRRVKIESDKERNSWFVLFPGPPAAGAFGCWKRGIKQTWCEKRREKWSDAESKRIREAWQRAGVERERAEAERHAKARKTAEWLLGKAVTPDGNLYLLKKGVKSAGDVRQSRGSLLMPLRAADGTLHSLQFIAPDGSKKFLAGGRIAGCFFTLCDKPDGPLVICEGYATGASVHEAIGFAVVCAMNCGNLLAVAQALRAKWQRLGADHHFREDPLAAHAGARLQVDFHRPVAADLYELDRKSTV